MRFLFRQKLIYLYVIFPLLAVVLFLPASKTLATAPSVSLIANPSTIERGQASALTWYATNSDNCTASGGWSGYLSTNNSANVYPVVNTEYGISCSGPEGIATARVTVAVTNPSTFTPSSSQSPTITYTTYPSPTPVSAPFTFTVACATNPSFASIGQSVTFAAASSGGASPIRYQWIGDVAGIGQTQTISFSNPGTKIASVTAVDSNNRTAIGTCRVEVKVATVVSTPSPAPRIPAATLAAAKKIEVDYEKICLEKGFIKPTAEVAEKPGDSIENREVAAASGAGLSSRTLAFWFISTLFFIFTTAFFTYRFTRRAAKRV